MMTEQAPTHVNLGDEAARGEWVQPSVNRLVAGNADAGGDTSVDGSGTLS